MPGIHAALDDPSVYKVVCMKSAQVAWTDGVLLNYIGKRIDIDPCPMILMFAKDASAKEFNTEKLEPMIEVTPTLSALVPITSKRDKDNRWAYKGFPGGFLKLVGSNSPGSVKSSPAPVVAVEEPDDCNENVREQGDTITLLEERTKTFPRRKVIFGGTPTIKGASRVEAGYLASDQRKFFVPCPHCGEHQVLSWDNVKWLSDESRPAHEVYGHVVLESAAYCCPHCHALWTDAEKNRAVRTAESLGAGWKATAAFNGVAGFYINELYAPFPGSRLQHLLAKFLAAEHALEHGEDTKMRVFVNSSLGEAFEYQTDIPQADILRERAEVYVEQTVPRGGLILTAGVDVQHDRLAVVIRAWGRGEESWLVYWGELYGSTLVAGQGAWADLDKLLTQPLRHATGAPMKVARVSIDGSDGNRTEIVHAYVRLRRHLGYMVVKGAAETTDDKREIYAMPRAVDVGKKGKAAKAGLQTFIVGTTRAKDLILETRVKLKAGPGAMHWYAGVRPDYWEQLTSEVKAPSRLNRNRKVWTQKSGVRNEALDCEVYALHAARSAKTHLLHEAHWAAIEQQLRQRPLLEEPAADVQAAPLAGEDTDEAAPTAAVAPAAAAVAPVATPVPTPAPRAAVQTSGRPAVKRRRQGSSGGAGGFKVGSW